MNVMIESGKEQSCEDCPHPKGYPCILCELTTEPLDSKMI